MWQAPRAGLLDGEQQHIGIAVVAKAAQLLKLAAGGTLMPQLLAGAAPVVHLTRGQGALNRLGVHPGHHQHGAIQPVLGHGGNQACLVKAQVLAELSGELLSGERLGPGGIEQVKGCLQGLLVHLNQSSRNISRLAAG